MCVAAETAMQQYAGNKQTDKKAKNKDNMQPIQVQRYANNYVYLYSHTLISGQ